METIFINYARRQIGLSFYYFYRKYYKTHCYMKNQSKVKRICSQNILKKLCNYKHVMYI